MAQLDYVLVGGGLQNALIGLAILSRRPSARIALIERGSALGGNHIWSFHCGDAPPDTRHFLDPLVTHRWPGYEVRFPGLHRALDEPYASITSARLDEVVRARWAAAPGCALLLGADATAVGPGHVELADGRRLQGRVVIDARGPEAHAVRGTAYQKFLGLEIRLERGVDLARPILMDATVPQRDGFRFFYTLPLAPDRLLVEDTYFSDGPDLDVPRLRAEVLSYLGRLGVRAAAVVREESGVLSLPWRAAPSPSLRSPLLAGYGGGWFHPVTGYSLPVALRLARLVAAAEPGSLFGPALAELSREHRRQARFCRLLNVMLYKAFSPDERWRVLKRFYRTLPDATIRRFYALALTGEDRRRVLCGAPLEGLSPRRG